FSNKNQKKEKKIFLFLNIKDED
ncbi:uncharacterized protein METZ01_LOCUS235712, partial [marine metagenome]